MPTLTLTRPETEARLILDGTPSVPVSIGTNDKIGCPGFSKAPVRDCGPACRVCAGTCYAMRPYRQYPSTRTAWDTNGDVMRTNPYGGVAYIHAWLGRKRVRPEYFRVHVSGDFISQAEVEAWALLATANPDVTFYAYTKATGLDFSAMPENFVVRWSQWDGLPVRGDLKCWCVPANGSDEYVSALPDYGTTCSGDCRECGYKCADRTIRDVYIHEH